ncbi:hypothetical protein ACGFJT_07795 [Actinomadura geliboluensis]|uniref:hypothetical protein n=1 Tax=Actinomadura geliboluensis TaxID=882440 RepID=UPI00371276F7
MICRSAIKPVFIGLGTAAVLAAGGASAIAAEAASPELTITVDAQKQLEPGKPISVTATVATTAEVASAVRISEVKLASSPSGVEAKVIKGCDLDKTLCDFGEVNTTKETATSVVEVGDELDAPVTVTVTMTVVGSFGEEQSTATSEPVALTFNPVKPDPPTETPTDPPSSSKPPTTSKPTKKPTSRTPSKPSPTPTKTAGASGSSGSGSGGSGSGSGSSSGTGGYVPPSPNSSFSPRNPQVALPPIQAPSPSVAPSPVPGAGTPQSRLQGNKAPVAQDITFERMASTQIAWLAALMVAFSLLLTQLRLGRRRVPAGAAAKRAKGTHRRPRRGMFGK